MGGVKQVSLALVTIALRSPQTKVVEEELGVFLVKEEMGMS